MSETAVEGALGTAIVKSPEEARHTILREHRADWGLFGNRTLILIILAGGVFAFWTPWSLVALMGVLLVDFTAFVVRRHSLLEEFARGTPRIVTAAQATAGDGIFAQTGAALPSMTDWERAAGLAEAPLWKTALRFRELVRLGQPAAAAVFLDVGCGDGRLGWRYGVAEQVARYVGLDVGFDLARELKRQLPASGAIQAAADDLPIKAGAVDFIACTEAFEHFAQPGDVLREFARCLGPNGKVAVQSPSALRLRNINPLHILQCVAGVWFPQVLQPLIVHEHTFTRTYTYHWDFTPHQFRQYAQQSGLIIRKLHCATYHFNPDGALLHRIAYFATRRVWLLTLLGWDMTVVLDKPGS